jgi:chromosomal replication initiation ATPase DnaA
MPDNIWDEICSRIREKVNRVSYETWFAPTTFVAADERSVTVAVPNSLFRDWIIKHYSSLITEALEQVHHPNARIRFVVAESGDGDARSHSIDERFDRVDQEVAAIRRDVDLILEKLTAS